MLRLASIKFIGAISAVALIAFSCSNDSKVKLQSKTDLSAAQEIMGQSTEIEWLKFDKGLLLAQAQNKQLLVDFTASWCHWCKRMDAETFQEASVIAAVNKNFIPIKVWGDSDNLLMINNVSISEKQLAAQAGVRSYPSFAVFTPDLEQVHLFKGYRNASNFIAEISKATAIPASANQ